MEQIEDEIEWFGFLPITFTTDLQETLEETLGEILQRNGIASSRVREEILAALRKNLFIFNNFVLRNILKFPAGFRMERKVSDVKIRGNAAALVGAISDAHAHTLQLRNERAVLARRLCAATNRNNGYKSLLRGQQKFVEMGEVVREVKKYLREVTEIYDRFKINACTRENDFDSLMEYKDLKSDYYREERNRLLEIADPESLEYIAERLNRAWWVVRRFMY